LVQSLNTLGMPLYGMQTPNGYSWAKDNWVSTGALVNRMNFALALAGGRLPGVRADWGQRMQDEQAGVLAASFDPSANAALAEKEKGLEAALLGGTPVSERTRQTVLHQANDTTAAEQAAAQFDLGGGKTLPGLRRAERAGNPNGAVGDPQAAVMAGLLLGSPEFQRR
jgi:hypothetical protein